MRTEKELKEMLTWKNTSAVIEQLLSELDEAKEIIYKYKRNYFLIKKTDSPKKWVEYDFKQGKFKGLKWRKEK